MQITLKFSCVQDVQSLLDIADFIDDIYMSNANSASDSKMQQLLQQYATITKIILYACVGSYTLQTIFFVGPMLAEYFYDGKLIPIFHIYIPYIYNQNADGFIIGIFINYLVYFVCYMNLISYDVLLFIIFGNMPMVSTIITIHLTELRELLDNSTDAENIRKKLVHIVLMHRKYNE